MTAVRASVSSNNGKLKLKDLRRLWVETWAWDDECSIQLTHNMLDSITVLERDRHRKDDDVS